MRKKKQISYLDRKRRYNIIIFLLILGIVVILSLLVFDFWLGMSLGDIIGLILK